ncbi:FtsK/SpoIIIE domain-containing protein [Auraticoccus monumenti]|uniref:DNA segregation ATPase FtsK/SpoIIIE, S-DNA-T family n=1 Tax=Auraticoccus monumenti TaxID=675864 RepID=A0A1G6WIG6_9ACTN|nr:FtsK/SpoIIIE domain-containing protein [Auraticoccus monumenti]SDD65559.1 DNA segregation ATPase FtsK/SpoIIIE, S-DNA-T family [Auraticoccus monumenti]
MSALAWSRRGAEEVWWWLSRTAGYGWRHKRLLLVGGWAVLSSWLLDLGWPWLPLLVVSPVLVLLVWERWWPVAFQVQVTDRLFRSRTRRWLRRRWASVMEACGLARRLPSNQSVQVPALVGLAWEGSQLVASPRLLTGQTVEDFEGAAERLRVALEANRLRVIADPAATGCRLVWSFGDPLAAAFAWPVPEDQAINLEWLTLGRTEDGQTWRLPLRVSTLVAGSTGAGKGSVLWGTVLSLAPAVRAGLVQLHGVDLKGGMELGLGKPLFTRYATDAGEAVIMLEEAVTACEERAKRLAGNSRLHAPTTDEPLIIFVIDELASLVAYLPDRDLLKRAEAALSRLLSIGRAPGFYVYAFLQDPRKETVRMRHLFTQSMGLRLRDREESAMVLGDGAVASGAACHKIHRSMPGVGYAVGEDGLIVKVRAGFVADDTIRATAARFPTPVQVPIVQAVPDEGEEAPAPAAARAPRKPRTSRRRTENVGADS